MSKMSHISVIEKYDEYHDAIHQLLSSILGSFSGKNIFAQSQQELSEQLDTLGRHYPFISILYLLDAKGQQVSLNVTGKNFKHCPKTGQGSDRSHRPYYLMAKESDSVIVTEPYLSSLHRELCLTAANKIFDEEGNIKGYIVLDFDLAETIATFTGDSKRIYFEPYFKIIYSIIVCGLLSVTLLLLFLAAKEFWDVFKALLSNAEYQLLPFGVVIYLTLALAIFDLGKTTLEEEVLLYKDILRHSSTRRTITRFIAAIIIAVSIEALMMIFKSALNGNGDYMVQAVWAIMAASFLLLCLAVYVFLGSKAEVNLRKQTKKTNCNLKRGNDKKIDAMQ